MEQYHTNTVPAYMEQAMGYVWEPAIVRWVAVYQSLKNGAIWDDGMTKARLPEGLFPLLVEMWGDLPKDYAYLLDLQERQVDVIAIAALEAFMQDVGPTERFEPWYLEETDAQRVSQMLIAYGERLARHAVQKTCRQCYFGYQWLPDLTRFTPCLRCNPMGA